MSASISANMRRITPPLPGRSSRRTTAPLARAMSPVPSLLRLS